ncbi:general secretion pathway protein GspB [Rhodoferax sp. UBA5149]|uniref:general secretion pathway protein GspB n=1 Tax=Rhodoferax sp. UBA5149 TaxID=1947379 RepID=UPI0025EC5448|nr:general secretion pathway protein GspB [Rhodoferax sp. UBA5149]
MSYILDALKRADAERERGAVPGLHAHQATTPTSRTTRSAQHRVGLAIAAALALAGVAIGLWVWQTPASAVRLAAVEPAVARPPVAAPLAQIVPTPTPTPTPAPTPAPAPTPKAKPLPLPVIKASAPQAAPAAVPLLSELSEDLRREIPALTITGAVYSDNPGQRLLLVNGQVLNQGSLVAPDVTLDEIRARSSVFSFRGTRFRVAH